MRRVLPIALGGLAIAGPLLFLALILSPRVGEAITGWIESHEPVSVRILDCWPYRDGERARSAIACRFAYVHGGERHVAQSVAWHSDDPFLTSRGLDRALAAQSSGKRRIAWVLPDRPTEARLHDPRWLTMPPLWLWLLAVFVAMAIAIHRLDPSDLPYRRGDMVVDPATGHLVAINPRRRRIVRWRVAGQGLAAGVIAAICAFGLSNQAANLALLLPMDRLQTVAGRLIGCDHRYHRSGRSGSDQIDCAVRYTFAGKTYRRQAESLHYGLLPTDRRMRDAVAAIMREPDVIAYVDPVHPGFAIAFIRRDAIVLFSWGLFAAQLLVCGAIAIGIMFASAVRWQRADRA